MILVKIFLVINYFAIHLLVIILKHHTAISSFYKFFEVSIAE